MPTGKRINGLRCPMVTGEDTKPDSEAIGLILIFILWINSFNVFWMDSIGIDTDRICRTHTRLKASLVMRMMTPPNQIESIIGILDSSHAERRSVIVIVPDDLTKTNCP